jgi:hypothetical protein
MMSRRCCLVILLYLCFASSKLIISFPPPLQRKLQSAFTSHQVRYIPHTYSSHTQRTHQSSTSAEYHGYGHGSRWLGGLRWWTVFDKISMSVGGWVYGGMVCSAIKKPSQSEYVRRTPRGESERLIALAKLLNLKENCFPDDPVKIKESQIHCVNTQTY